MTHSIKAILTAACLTAIALPASAASILENAMAAFVQQSLSGQAAPEPACIPDIVAIESWEIVAIDEDTNELSVAFKVTSPKPIRIIDAGLTFGDVLDGRMGTMALDRDTPASGEWVQTDHWGPHSFERLLVLRREDVTAEVCVRSVLFDDGEIRRAAPES